MGGNKQLAGFVHKAAHRFVHGRSDGEFPGPTAPRERVWCAPGRGRPPACCGGPGGRRRDCLWRAALSSSEQRSAGRGGEDDEQLPNASAGLSASPRGTHATGTSAIERAADGCLGSVARVRRLERINHLLEFRWQSQGRGQSPGSRRWV